jgi:hypothetical protein
MRHMPVFFITVCLAVATASLLIRAQDEFDFAVAPAFLASLEAGHTILPTFRVHIDARSKVKDPPEDCEVHLAGTLLDREFGDPEAVVSELPNECRYLPGATQPSTTSTKVKWTTLLDSKVVGHEMREAMFDKAAGGSSLLNVQCACSIRRRSSSLITCRTPLVRIVSSSMRRSTASRPR